jgi:hypothetical protein
VNQVEAQERRHRASADPEDERGAERNFENAVGAHQKLGVGEG